MTDKKHYLPPAQRRVSVTVRVHTWALDVADAVARRQETTRAGIIGGWINEMAHRVERAQKRGAWNE